MQSKASAVWKGGLKDGSGAISGASGVLSDVAYTFATRFEGSTGTNPEELIAAAHAGCFSMALSNGLAKAGHEPDSVKTTARVHLVKGADGFSITKIELSCRAQVPGIDDATFSAKAEAAKTGCPVSKALSAVEITMDAQLEN